MNGYYEKVTRIKENAVPIDNIAKFAWADDDYETVEIWHEYTEAEIEEQKQIEISALKQKLTDTDYIIIKITEGVASKEEYAYILEQRKMWRKEINDLEDILSINKENYNEI